MVMAFNYAYFAHTLASCFICYGSVFENLVVEPKHALIFHILSILTLSSLLYLMIYHGLSIRAFISVHCECYMISHYITLSI